VPGFGKLETFPPEINTYHLNKPRKCGNSSANMYQYIPRLGVRSATRKVNMYVPVSHCVVVVPTSENAAVDSGTKIEHVTANETRVARNLLLGVPELSRPPTALPPAETSNVVFAIPFPAASDAIG
jgi:hypothetical protein